MAKQIPISQREYAIVDDDDFERLTKYKWYYKGQRYAYRGQWHDGKTIQIPMHREIIEVPKGMFVDHINGNGLDNRKENLRIVSHQKNMFNMAAHADGTSTFKGVYWDRSRSKWAVQIAINGKSKYIGRFNSEVDAAKAYDIAAVKYFGENARLNNI